MVPDSHERDTPAPVQPVGSTASLPLAIVLFGFWTILSGKLDALHLGFGAVSATAVSLASRRLFALEPPVGRRGRDPFSSLPWLSIALYLPWLVGQIAVASFQVASIVLRPRIEIEPRMFRFRQPLPHNSARATLANSITLTPGTVTIDVMGDEYLVHALTEESAAGLEGEEVGGMKERVVAIFRG